MSRTDAIAGKPSLAGKVAVVTGASQGIGLAICRAFAKADCDLAMSSRSGDKLEKAAEQVGKHGARVFAQTCDVGDEDSVAQLFSKIRKEMGRIDILVNNAGIAHELANVEGLPFRTWRSVMGANLDGLFLCSRAALPMMKTGGTIVNNLSVAAHTVFKDMSAYVASKHGGLGFTNTLREELRERGIRVLALLPGAVDTEIWGQFWPQAPRAKMPSAETVAQAVLHAVVQPPEATIWELRIGPTAGAL